MTRRLLVVDNCHHFLFVLGEVAKVMPIHYWLLCVLNGARFPLSRMQSMHFVEKVVDVAIKATKLDKTNRCAHFCTVKRAQYQSRALAHGAIND
jgi:hypothetical protein